MQCEIKDYKVNVLPLKGQPNSRYYVPNGIGTDIDEYITDKSGNYHKVNPIQTVSLSVSFADDEVPSGTINGINNIFTISNIPVAGSIKLYLNGQRLKNLVDYTVIGATITMTTIPYPGDILTSDYRY